MNLAGILLDLARYLRNHPDAWKNVNTPITLADPEHRSAVVQALRNEIGDQRLSSVSNWCDEHCSNEQWITLLEHTAKKLLNCEMMK